MDSKVASSFKLCMSSADSYHHGVSTIVVTETLWHRKPGYCALRVRAIAGTHRKPAIFMWKFLHITCTNTSWTSKKETLFLPI